MIGSTRNLAVYAHPEPADMRKGYDTLFGLVRDVLGQDPLCGHLFLFVSKDRRRTKVLYWDGTGLCIFQKRLERGRFVAPWERQGAALTMTTSELSLFLEGSKAVRTSLSPPMLFPPTIRSTAAATL
jgi:transposase